VMECAERTPAGDDVAHVHVMRSESCTIECSGHLDLPVDALLAQNRDRRSRACCNEWRSDILAAIEAQLRRKTWIVDIRNARMLLTGGDGIITQALQRVRCRRPCAMQVHSRFVEQDRAAFFNAYSRMRRRHSDGTS